MCVCVCWVKGKVTGVQRRGVYVIVLITGLSRTWGWQSCVLDGSSGGGVYVSTCVWLCVTVSVVDGDIYRMN